MSKVFDLDCLGEICPVPLLKVQDKMKQLEIGDTLVVNVDYSCAMKNVPDWAKNEGHDVEVKTVNNGEWKITIKKNK